MKKIKHIKEAAFPQVGIPSCEGILIDGLSKREYFAGLAMQNLQNVLLRKSGQEKLNKCLRANDTMDVYEVIAMEAVAFADALLKELEEDVV